MARNQIKLAEMVRQILTEAELTPEQEIVFQNLGKQYEKFVTGLDDAVGDEKVKAVLMSGLKDGDIQDDQIAIKEISVGVSNLSPTQNEIDVQKSLSWPLQKDAKGLQKYLEGVNVVIMAPIITLNGKWVIDGHHRWSQVYSFNAQATMKCANLVFPGLNPLTGLKAVQTAIAAIKGDVPQNAVSGTNLLKAGEDQIIKDCIDLMKSGSNGLLAAKILKKFNKVKTLNFEECARYIWQQVEVMQKESQPAQGAPERGYMPQTDQVPGEFDAISKLLKKGVINWNEPIG